MTKKCIVCGKPIPKRTHTFWIEQPVEAAPERPMFAGSRSMMPARAERLEGHIEKGSFSSRIYTSRPPQNRAECARWSNHEVVSHKYGAPGMGIRQFTTWDRESYRDPHFHSEECAAKQGRASAHAGDRFTWKGS